MELKISKERVLSAASKYPNTAGVLQELFPEAFVKEVRLKFEGITLRDCTCDTVVALLADVRRDTLYVSYMYKPEIGDEANGFTPIRFIKQNDK